MCGLSFYLSITVGVEALSVAREERARVQAVAAGAQLLQRRAVIMTGSNFSRCRLLVGAQLRRLKK